MASKATEMSAPCSAQRRPAPPSALRRADPTRPLCVRVLDSTGSTLNVIDALTKHLPDQTVLENFMKNNVYSLRENPRLEEIRNKARADKKERAKSKGKAKATTPSTA